MTSRASLAGLVVREGATRLTLDLFSHDEALELVLRVLGRARVDAEPVSTSELIRLCARLPLALRIAAGHASVHPNTMISDLVAEMDGDRAQLDMLSSSADEPTEVRAVFDWSYRRLTVEQARLFRQLGLHPGPDISLPAAAVWPNWTWPWLDDNLMRSVTPI